MMSEQAQHDVWADRPDARVAVAVPPSGTAETFADGYRLSGRWHYSSGCEHADWLLLGARVPIPGAEPADKVMLVPRVQVVIEDTWHVTGMRGTGSNTVVARDITVPFHRTISHTAVMNGQLHTPFLAEAPYHVPLLLGALSDLAGPQLGLARAALEFVIDNAPPHAVSAPRSTASRRRRRPCSSRWHARHPRSTRRGCWCHRRPRRWIVRAVRASALRCWTGRACGCSWHAESSRRAMRSAN